MCTKKPNPNPNPNPITLTLTWRELGYLVLWIGERESECGGGVGGGVGGGMCAC